MLVETKFGARQHQRDIAMQPDMRFSDPETDEALRLPSRKVAVALTALSLLMLALAALSS